MMPLYIDESDKRYERFLEHEKEHGWSPDELWSLDATLATWLTPRLKGFRNQVEKGFTPGCIETNEEWLEILDKMIASFEIIQNEDTVAIHNENDMVQEGLDLFREYFFCLWY